MIIITLFFLSFLNQILILYYSPKFYIFSKFNFIFHDLFNLMFNYAHLLTFDIFYLYFLKYLFKTHNLILYLSLFF